VSLYGRSGGTHTAFLVSPIRSTYPAHRNLFDMINIIR